jgi:hypothetical protein
VNLKVNALGIFLNQGHQLNAKDGDLFLKAFDFTSIGKADILSIVKDTAVEPVRPGILVSLRGPSFFLLLHDIPVNTPGYHVNINQ